MLYLITEKESHLSTNLHISYFYPIFESEMIDNLKYITKLFKIKHD